MRTLSLLAIGISGLLLFSCKSVLPPAPVYPVPSEKQLAWHEMEQYAFVHFTTNTYTNKEWGFGNESPDVFNPTEFNADQWVNVIKEAGLNGIILVCKHHDGFCLWPSAYTDHSVKNCKWRNGKGDVVKEVAEACHKNGLKFGIYLSPWDRNSKDYGTPAYIEYYRNQLKEIISNYGPIFELWFDGANGGDGYYGGANETRTIDASKYYDWPNTIKLIQSIDSSVLFFSDAGPDIRWCGNEEGYIGDSNWNNMNIDTLYAGKPDIYKLLNSGEIEGKSWVPAEVDVSIRPGWFYHPEQDSLVKSAEQLFQIYLNSVGRGSNLLLNIPPDRRGLINDKDVKSLQEWKALRDKEFGNNLALHAKVVADSYRGNSEKYIGANVTDANKDSYWATNDDVKSGTLEINLNKAHTIKYVVLQEYIKLGQRIKSFSISIWNGSKWIEVVKESTIGYKRIIKLDPVTTDKIRIEFTDSRACPVISNVEIY